VTESSPNSRFIVPADQAGHTLAQVVRELQPGISWNKARELCQRGKVQCNGAVATDGAQRLRAGDEIAINVHAPRVRANVFDEGALLHVDSQFVVVDKPAGLISVPFEEGDKDTLIDRVRALLRRKGEPKSSELGIVQRLDKDTTGVMMFTRTLAAKRHMQQLFRTHDIERRYVAIVHGDCKTASFDTQLLRDRGDGIRGSYGLFRRPKGPVPDDSQRAITHVRPLRALKGATLVECRIDTGRQHQIRIHLSEAGHPLVGEAVYVRDYSGPRISAARPMLHARTLGFAHPRHGEHVSFQSEPPDDFKELLERLLP
jgi:23S rRNA pseudouridine1911/1915/1917 synthase